MSGKHRPSWDVEKYGTFNFDEYSAPLPSWVATQRMRGLEPTPWRWRGKDTCDEVERFLWPEVPPEKNGGARS
jgi:hypothetical protein